jgi:hypothetical protein
MNPIEESFSACESPPLIPSSYPHLSIVKAYLRANFRRFFAAEDPLIAMYDATATITPEKAAAWFKHAG